MSHRIQSPRYWDIFRNNLLRNRETPEAGKEIRICTGGGCIASGALELKRCLQDSLKREGMDIPIKETGCMGPCAHGPVVNIQPDNIYYRALTPDDVPRIVVEHLKEGIPVEGLLMDRGITDSPIEEKIVLRNCGRIDPLDIRDYIAEGGYSALARLAE